MAVVFQNQGVIDLDAVRLMGVSVKTGSDNPVGYFGTGLKYALSVLLREGCRIDIWRGRDRHAVSIRETTVRGEPFQVVTLDGQDLGFTTHHGHTWQPWQAYRELWCNTHDEPEGHVSTTESAIHDPDDSALRDDLTTIVVEGAAIEQAHRDRHQTILQTEPLYVLAGVEAHAGPSEHVFYRGIRVGKLEKPSLLTYNLTGHQYLTEDRTLLYPWMVPQTVARALVQATQRPLIEQVLTCVDGHLEGRLPYSQIRDTQPSQQFMDVANELRLDRRLRGSGRSLFVAYADTIDRYGYSDPRIVQPTQAQQYLIEQARRLLEDRGVSTQEYHLVLREGTDHVSAHSGIVSLPASLLAGTGLDVALGWLEGIAVMRGGTPLRQLLHRTLTGEWLSAEEARARRDDEEVPF